MTTILRNKKVGFVFVHGWGFTPSYWNPLAQALSDFPQTFWDRGYFGQEILPVLGAHISWIGIGHSLGGVHLKSLPLSGFVGLSTFVKFLPYPAERSTHLLQRMERRLTESPEETLAWFYQVVKLDYHPPLLFQKDLLFSDFQLLQHGEGLKTPHFPTLYLYTEEDPVLDVDAVVPQLQGCDVRILPNQRHHALGYQNSLWCSEQIRSWLTQHFFLKN